MRIHNLHHFTENHRYCVYRDFDLGTVGQKMLSLIYQPMVGGFAIALYQFLFGRVPLEQVGYSKMEQQRHLFLSLGIEPSEKGRKLLIEQASRLEAVGLLQCSRVYVPESEDYLYEYELQPPLTPSEFFKTQHLTLLLRDKLGKFAVLSLQEQMFSREASEYGRAMSKENLTVPFYDIFQLNTHTIDYELEQAISEMAISRQPENRQEEPLYNYADIIMRFPRGSLNRKHVESLRFDQDKMGVINYTARKYDLSIQDLCRLLDEDGIFAADGSLQLDELQHKANLHFRQGKKRQEERSVAMGKVVALRQEDQEAADMPEEHSVQMEFYLEVPPQLLGKCDVHQYNMMLRNEPHTRLLPKFFPGTVPDNLLDIFEKIDLNYKLPGEVINVLIHYLMMLLTSGGEQRINRKFVETIASNMLLKQVTTYEKAVSYIRDQEKLNKAVREGGSTAAAGGRSRNYSRGNKAKPEIPIVPSAVNTDKTLSEEEFAELLKMAEQMQNGQKK
ncbi:helicase DnaB [Paenibacillus yonginensis]|uniref:Helicase DnaB n=1 Tax=Paenibacillus yonginensis TaxID=1462996 RepID=A0A1B1N2F9_9BACL|nr:DnaD domain protein [Paenibacillus yonginensis]ANS75624.1 helicase DnaB [Paenibacillus yonginensis]